MDAFFAWVWPGGEESDTSRDSTDACRSSIRLETLQSKIVKPSVVCDHVRTVRPGDESTGREPCAVTARRRVYCKEQR
jgi:hypothetical protein